MAADQHVSNPIGNRLARRMILAAEKRERESGEWSPWQIAPITQPPPGAQGWVREMQRVIKNTWCVMLCRPIVTPWGVGTHAAIRTASETELSWKEKQRIKDEVFGAGLLAVEIMPPKHEIVDGANMYHLWIFPEGVGLPFGL